MEIACIYANLNDFFNHISLFKSQNDNSTLNSGLLSNLLKFWNSYREIKYIIKIIFREI